MAARLGHRAKLPGTGDQGASLVDPGLRPAPEVADLEPLASQILGRLRTAAAAAAHGDHRAGEVELTDPVEDAVLGDVDRPLDVAGLPFVWVADVDELHRGQIPGQGLGVDRAHLHPCPPQGLGASVGVGAS